MRATATWLGIGSVLVGMIALAALIGITSVLHVVADDLAIAVESVHVSSEIESQIRAHDEANSPSTKAVSRVELLRAVEKSARLVQSEEEERWVDALYGSVHAYLRPGAGEAEITAALEAARRVAAINIDQAREARERAATWDRWANVGGTTAVVVHLIGLTVFLVWLRRGPLRTIGAVSEAMDRFRAGDLDARAPELGSVELQLIAQSFNAAATGLVHARQRQSEYVATAIHELRTPLTAIQLATGYLAPDRPLPPETRIRELVDLVNRQLTRLNAIVGDVLGATRIEAGDLVLLRERFDLRDIAATSVQSFRAIAPEHLIDLAIPDAPLEYEGDRARLGQVLNNLLSNAVKYSPRGSHVHVSLVRRTDAIVMSVSDEGSGVAPEDRERIFEVFQRRSATHEEAPGTSLGLWVSRRVVEAHGGRIEIDSRAGRGSTFRVVLPLAVPEPPPAPATTRATLAPGHLRPAHQG